MMMMMFIIHIYFYFILLLTETQLDSVSEFNRKLNYVNVGLDQEVCAYNMDNDSHFHGHQLYCKFSFY